MSHYVVYLSGGGSSSSWTTTASEYTVGSLSYSTTYYWQVRAVDDAGNYATSPTRSFSVYAPTVYGTLSGYVYKAGTTTGISGAVVDYYYSPASIPGGGETLMGAGGGEYTVSAVTDISGYYCMYNVPVGYHDFQAYKLGYNTVTVHDVYVPETGKGVNFWLLSASGDDFGCLAAGTLIATADGEVAIEYICKGDVVLSCNESTGEIEPEIVYRTTAHKNFGGYLLVNDRLRITANHPVYTSEGIVLAADLRIGDMLLTITGTEAVTGITDVRVLATVYNFEVMGNHNYYADGILVHNVLKEDIGEWHPGCPFLYFWDDTGYLEEENNILPQSTRQERQGLDVVDYYMVQNAVPPVNDSYRFQIYEPALERTYLDEAVLAMIDYDSDTLLAVTPDGSIMGINGPQAPASCTDSDGSDVLEFVAAIGGLSLEVSHNETLTLNFPAASGFSEAKLIICHKADFDVFPYEWPVDPRWYKCSIHIQVLNGQGDWYDFATVPARLNKMVDLVDITQLRDIIGSGQPIRLLITGTHIIDFVGLDVSDTPELDIEYVKPFHASYCDEPDSPDLSYQLAEEDRLYAAINPGRGIDISFPYKGQARAHRALLFISRGHYYTLSEIDIKQPVHVKAVVEGGTGGTLTLSVSEIDTSGNIRILAEITAGVNDWSNDMDVLGFVQDARERYVLAARFEGCDADTAISVVLTSLRDSEICHLRYSPRMGSGAEVVVELDDILWDITGVRFDRIANRFITVKDTLLQFGINEYYGYDTSAWSNYTWDFGDGLRTQDTCPTYVYDMLGIYLMNLTVQNAGSGMYFFSETRIEVIDSPPAPVIEVSQEIEITLTVAGHKGNTVGIRIYEDGFLILSADVTKAAGQFDAIQIKFDRYFGRTYDIELLYDAAYKGANPTKLYFSSDDPPPTFSVEFNTVDGFHQLISVSSSCLDDAAAVNPTFRFDASGSYDIDGCIVSYGWDFGDGSIAQGIAVEHTYSVAGTYEVTLTVTDDDGAVAKETVFVEVR
ncbi:MAG: PKD domain-containing protein [Thermoplasmata archaeon]